MKIPPFVIVGLVLHLGSPVSAQEPAKDSPQGSAGSVAGTSPPTSRKIEWKAMDFAQRKTYMKKVVLPAMQKVFAEFDPQRYSKITCYGCHGDGVSKEYEMPNGALVKLPTELAGWKMLQDKKPEITQFMATTVKPRMAALLGEDEWTPAHQEGFGCYSCHTKMAGAAVGATPSTGTRQGAGVPGRIPVRSTK